MKKPVCYIIGAGEHFYHPKAKDISDIIIAADGGYAYLENLSIIPDLTVGDFDSLGYMPEVQDKISLPMEKDVTDTAAAIEIGWSKGYRCFAIYGGTGGRPDHTIANIQCLANIAVRGGRGYLYDKDYVITAIHNDCIKFEKKSKGFISVFAHTSKASGVSEKGLKYSLYDAVLSNYTPLGISNQFTGQESEISVREGTLIIVFPLDCKEINT